MSVRGLIRRPGAIRWALVVALVAASYFVLQRWLECVAPLPGHGPYLDLIRLCSFGFGIPAMDAQGPGAMWWRPVLALAYLVVAVWVALTKRFSFTR